MGWVSDDSDVDSVKYVPDASPDEDDTDDGGEVFKEVTDGVVVWV